MCDPIPAGMEIINENLRGSEKDNFWSWFWWFSHKNYRDNQVELFADSMSSGTYSFSYILRATTPGLYSAPPTKIEEMYSPEVFGRWNSEIVQIV